ncbi:MAG: hypothetical protein LBP19_05305 [Treponema sp.]|jgi:hypothetical protein|nr:hypothetical protein [Treponema sp.]
MEKLIDAWDTPDNWAGTVSPIGETKFYPHYVIKKHGSIALKGTCMFTPPSPVDCMTFISFSFQGSIHVDIDGIFYETKQHKHFSRVHFPAPETITKITITTDYAVVSDLRTWSEELPRDIIDNLIEEIEPLLPLIPCGELEAEAGEKLVRLLSDNGFLANNTVITFNGETHEIRNIHENGIEFYSAFDGEGVLSDFSGSFSIVLSIKKGYYDREIAIPSVTIWYDSPRPRANDFELALRTCMIGDTLYTEKSGSNYTWDITFEIVARSPELVQHIAAVIRRYLSAGAVWVQGLKTEIAFTETAVNDEPSEEFDILPRVLYRIAVDIKEGNIWQSETAGKATLRASPK